MDLNSVRSYYAGWLRDWCTVTRGAVTVASVRCRIIDYRARDMVSGIVAGDRKAILYATDISGGGIAIPLRKGDRLVWNDGGSSIALTVQATSVPRKVGTVVVAVEAQVRGA